MVVKIADPLLMREINKYHVLETIRCHSRISRVEISERTLLSGTTVSAITGALIEEGLVEAIHVEHTGNGKRGRPRVLLDLIPDAAYVFGINISPALITTTIANFKGEAVYSVQMPVQVAERGTEAIVDVIENSIHVCIAAHGLNRDKIKGIGIGIPGIFDPESGQVHASSVFSEGEMPLAQLLEVRLGLRAKMAKQADLIALAESWFGYAQRNHSFAAITIDQTAGLALWIDDDLHRGASTLGAAFGHIKVGNEGRLCTCGQYDCLNTYMALSDRRPDLASTGSARIDDAYGSSTFSEFCHLATSGDQQARTQFEKLADKLGVGVSHIVNLINPEKIIIVTEEPEYRRLVEETFLKSVERNSFATHFAATDIIFHTINEQHWARGAAALMLRDIYKAPWNEASKEKRA
ncbi:MAG: ROK family transcriptional regulator [Stappiaceae bacterium]